MYNRLYKNLYKEKLVYSQQFGFQEVQSTENILLVVETEPTWFTQTKKYLSKKKISMKNKIPYNYPKSPTFIKRQNFL